jgi:DNA repair and recombination RAD54-like protein
MVRRWGNAQGTIATPVLIISYESLRDHAKTLKNSPIGLLLCDEGHRLKNSCK